MVVSTLEKDKAALWINSVTNKVPPVSSVKFLMTQMLFCFSSVRVCVHKLYIYTYIHMYILYTCVCVCVPHFLRLRSSTRGLRVWGFCAISKLGLCPSEQRSMIYRLPYTWIKAVQISPGCFRYGLICFLVLTHLHSIFSEWWSQWTRKHRHFSFTCQLQYKCARILTHSFVQ